MSYNPTSCPERAWFFPARTCKRLNRAVTLGQGAQRKNTRGNPSRLFAIQRKSDPSSLIQCRRLRFALARVQPVPMSCLGLQQISAALSAVNRRKVRYLRILSASKTDNGIVSEDSQFDYRSAEAPECEPYACFVQRKEQIAAWLRAGYSVKGVWNACRRATPPFEGSYQTFWRYCRMHDLSVARGQRPALPGQSRSKPRPVSKAHGAPKSPQIWPRLEGKPPQFVPRVED